MMVENKTLNYPPTQEKKRIDLPSDNKYVFYCRDKNVR